MWEKLPHAKSNHIMLMKRDIPIIFRSASVLLVLILSVASCQASAAVPKGSEPLLTAPPAAPAHG